MVGIHVRDDVPGYDWAVVPPAQGGSTAQTFSESKLLAFVMCLFRVLQTTNMMCSRVYLFIQAPVFASLRVRCAPWRIISEVTVCASLLRAIIRMQRCICESKLRG